MKHGLKIVVSIIVILALIICSLIHLEFFIDSDDNNSYNFRELGVIPYSTDPIYTINYNYHVNQDGNLYFFSDQDNHSITNVIKCNKNDIISRRQFQDSTEKYGHNIIRFNNDLLYPDLPLMYESNNRTNKHIVYDHNLELKLNITRPKLHSTYSDTNHYFSSDDIIEVIEDSNGLYHYFGRRHMTYYSISVIDGIEFFPISLEDHLRNCYLYELVHYNDEIYLLYVTQSNGFLNIAKLDPEFTMSESYDDKYVSAINTSDNYFQFDITDYNESINYYTRFFIEYESSNTEGNITIQKNNEDPISFRNWSKETYRVLDTIDDFNNMKCWNISSLINGSATYTIRFEPSQYSENNTDGIFIYYSSAFSNPTIHISELMNISKQSDRYCDASSYIHNNFLFIFRTYESYYNLTTIAMKDYSIELFVYTFNGELVHNELLWTIKLTGDEGFWEPTLIGYSTPDKDFLLFQISGRNVTYFGIDQTGTISKDLTYLNMEELLSLPVGFIEYIYYFGIDKSGYVHLIFNRNYNKEYDQTNMDFNYSWKKINVSKLVR